MAKMTEVMNQDYQQILELHLSEDFPLCVAFRLLMKQEVE
jgi:hypothetical protein